MLVICGDCRCPCVYFGLPNIIHVMLPTGAKGDGGTMAVMHIPPAESPDRAEAPPEPPQAIKDLLELRNRIDTGKRNTEIIEGRLVVSPKPVPGHERVCRWLDEQLRDVASAKGWFIDGAGEITLPPTDDLIEPDLMVLADADDLPDLESQRPLDHVLLVAEVASRSSIRTDREVKPHACALANVPLYLLVDRFAKPLTVSLFSSPGADGYTEVHAVPVGGKLHVPAPFDVTLDTSTLPVPR
jgi:Uma2 family endonuclease